MLAAVLVTEGLCGQSRYSFFPSLAQIFKKLVNQLCQCAPSLIVKERLGALRCRHGSRSVNDPFGNQRLIRGLRCGSVFRCAVQLMLGTGKCFSWCFAEIALVGGRKMSATRETKVIRDVANFVKFQ